jgi:hypothetical protein
MDRAAGVEERSVHALSHSIAVHPSEASQGIEDVGDQLGHNLPR